MNKIEYHTKRQTNKSATNKSERHIVSVRAEQEQNKNITIGEPHEQGLVFKWGSLIGISLPSSAANGTAFVGAADVIFRPREFTGAITNDWTTVPRCTTNFGNYGDPATDHLSRAHTATNFAKGVGDICRYMGVVEGTRWRIPTQSEWNELYGSSDQNGGQSMKLGSGWVAGNYYPLSGYAMGAGRKYVSISGDEANARVTSAEPWINGAIFLPPSGIRQYDNGVIYSIGSWGHYWSSTAAEINLGYYMGFDSSNVYPQRPIGRTYAWSIRCIRE